VMKMTQKTYILDTNVYGYVNKINGLKTPNLLDYKNFKEACLK